LHGLLSFLLEENIAEAMADAEAALAALRSPVRRSMPVSLTIAAHPLSKIQERAMGDPLLNLLFVVVIGIVAGIVFDRVAGPGWLARQFAGPRGYVTSALVGTAGALLGYEIVRLAVVSASGFMLFLAALIGAVVVLFAWRAIR
jgi:uncharacterized membrane protein YeaQ/YmgE (transglycosylase-associated protein family)